MHKDLKMNPSRDSRAHETNVFQDLTWIFTLGAKASRP